MRSTVAAIAVVLAVAAPTCRLVGATHPTLVSNQIRSEGGPVHHEPAILTAYCPCRICCGKWAKIARGITASTARAIEGVTAACPRSMPLGTVLDIAGVGLRWCEDRGGAIVDIRLDTGTLLFRKIDVFHAKHDAALQFGRRLASVRTLHMGVH